MISYVSDGPKFDEETFSQPLPLTCSEADLNWSYKLPEVLGSEQQKLSKRIMQDMRLGEIYSFDQENDIVTFSAAASELFAKNYCPKFLSLEFTYEVTSDVLGTAKRKISQ